MAQWPISSPTPAPDLPMAKPPQPADPAALIAKAAGPAKRALQLHPFYRGKIQNSAQGSG